MTVLVAIPYHRTAAPYIDEAVASVLAQTERDLVCLVAGDGEFPPVRSSDPRLVVVGFPSNEGAPMTLQAMLLASPYEHFAPMGADDWIEPGYLEGLLALGAKAATSWTLIHFDETGSWEKRDYPGNPAHTEFGVFDTETLRSLGGYGVERRVGQDTLLYLQLLPRLVEIARIDAPRYHKRIHATSLTHAPETTFGSAYRTEVFEHNGAVADTIYRWGFGDLGRIRAFREWLAAEQQGILAERVAMVRDALAVTA